MFIKSKGDQNASRREPRSYSHHAASRHSLYVLYTHLNRCPPAPLFTLLLSHAPPTSSPSRSQLRPCGTRQAQELLAFPHLPQILHLPHPLVCNPLVRGRHPTTTLVLALPLNGAAIQLHVDVGRSELFGPTVDRRRGNGRGGPRARAVGRAFPRRVHVGSSRGRTP